MSGWCLDCCERCPDCWEWDGAQTAMGGVVPRVQWIGWYPDCCWWVVHRLMWVGWFPDCCGWDSPQPTLGWVIPHMLWLSGARWVLLSGAQTVVGGCCPYCCGWVLPRLLRVGAAQTAVGGYCPDLCG